jgi:hypothetical protein
MSRIQRTISLGAAVLVLGAAVVLASAAQPRHPRSSRAPSRTDVALEVAKIYWEYNSSANDLGVQVSLDGEEWKQLRIRNPANKTIFEVAGKGSLAGIGLSELFFEGAEPTLDEVPLRDMLDGFPEGVYAFDGKTVDGEEIEGESFFSHVIPAGPVVAVTTGANDLVRVRWDPVTTTPPGFPSGTIQIAAYQVLVDETFDATVPSTTFSLTLPPEFVASLAGGDHHVEVLAIDRDHNQTITEASFAR